MESSRETVYEYILREEKEYQTGPGVPVIDGWDFQMHDHIRKTVLYKYGQLADNKKSDDIPVENIILPILNVAYRLEDIDVKHIDIYVDSKSDFHKSFIVKKFHDKWAREFEIDTFIDKTKTSWIDFGLGLVKNRGKNPEYVPLQRLAFCDQSDILSGPICEKHTLSPDQLMEMKGKWDADKIDEVITMARAEKSNSQVQGQKQKTPGNYIEVYELHAMCPEDWNPNVKNPDMDKWTRQMHVVAYYQSENNEKNGIALYQGPERESIYDAVKRDDIFGRACGYGGGEELFEPQVWHTYSRIQMKEMLDKAAMMIVKTTDGALAKRQKITDLEKGELLEHEEGTTVEQLYIAPINWSVFDKWQEDMKVAARTQGSANDPQLGIEPKAGTPMGLQQIVVNQGQGIHDYRRGIFSTFLVRLYNKWFLRYVTDEISKGDEWLEELDLDEMQWLAEKLSKVESDKRKHNMILDGKTVQQMDLDEFKEKFKKEYLGGDNKKFITILKDEFKDLKLNIKINIAGKQKNLTNMSEKIIGFMRAIIAQPQLLANKGWADLLNQVIEYSGLDPVNFSSLKPEDLVAPQQTNQAPAQPVLAGSQQ